MLENLERFKDWNCAIFFFFFLIEEGFQKLFGALFEFYYLEKS